MNVIRMIKLFGWESKMAEQIDEKRMRELLSVRKRRLLGMSNTMCKCVFLEDVLNCRSLTLFQLPHSHSGHARDVLHLRESSMCCRVAYVSLTVHLV